MPNITGQMINLDLETFNATYKGEFFHFLGPFDSSGNSIFHSQPIKIGNNPITLVNQGITTRE